MLKPGWDDDLKAFVKSWKPTDEWLDAAEHVHPHRWQSDKNLYLQQLGGIRLENLPERLSRRDIFGIAQGSDSDPITAFLWTMAWGHNGTNYGAARVNKITADDNAETKVAQIIALAQAGSIRAAFDALHGPYRLTGLGTSFGSKLIYFAGFDPNPDSTQPLIFNSLVAKALAEVIDPALAQPKKVRRVVSPDDVVKLADAMDRRYAPMVWVGALLGLRWGEVAALRIGSLDQLARTLTVTETVTRDEHGRPKLGPPKSEAGVRTLSMPQILVNILAGHQIAYLSRTQRGPVVLCKLQAPHLGTGDSQGPTDRRRLP